MIKFVTPCCHKPLSFKSLDEVAVVEYPPKEEGDTTLWGINSRCCFDYQESPAGWNLKHERQAVYKASLKAAETELERRIKEIRSEFQEELIRFGDIHDPNVERVYVTAIYGPFTSNYYVAEFDDRENAKSGFDLRCNNLLSFGCVEIEDSDRTEGMYDQRSFRKGELILRVGYWSQPVSHSDGGPPYDHATATGMYDHY